MYESPVNFVLQDVQSQITQDAERTIINAIGKCGVTVDKDELIKAMKYDRDQYTKGYKDGVNNTLDKLRSKIESMSGDIETLSDVLGVIDKYSKSESEVSK